MIGIRLRIQNTYTLCGWGWWKSQLGGFSVFRREPGDSRHTGHRPLLEALSADSQTSDWVGSPPQNTANHEKQAGRRESVSEWEGKRNERKKNWLLCGRKKITRKTLSFQSLQLIRFRTYLKTLLPNFPVIYLFIYTLSCFQHFAARLIFLKLHSDQVTPLLKNPNSSSLPIKWSPISLASYLRPSIIWPQTSRPTL